MLTLFISENTKEDERQKIYSYTIYKRNHGIYILCHFLKNIYNYT